MLSKVFEEFDFAADPGVLELLRIRDKCIQVTDTRIHQTSSEVSWWHGIGDHWRGPVSLLNLDELPMILEKVPDVPGLVYAHVSERFTLGLSGRVSRDPGVLQRVFKGP